MLETRQLILRDLIDRAVITENDLEPAREHAATIQGTILQALVALGRLSQRELALARARVSEQPFVDLERYRIDLQNASLIPEALARRATAFPLFVADGVATVGLIDPDDIQTIELIRQATHHEIAPVVCDEQALIEIIDAAYTGRSAQPDAPSGSGFHSGSPARRLDDLLDEAVRMNATSLHIDPDDERPAVRFRAEGRIEDLGPAPLVSHPDLVAAARRFADLPIPESPAPQEGEFEFATADGRARAEVTIVPTREGESVVIRFTSQPSGARPLDRLGMPEEALLFVRTALTHDAGLFLIAGPFASGRTTTAAAAASQLTEQGRILVAVEDRTETRIPRARHLQTDPATGFNSTAAIRLAERLDADALFIGEIRDAETARAAIRAASAGMLVIATINTDPAHTARDRMIELGIAEGALSRNALGALVQFAACPAPGTRAFLFATEQPDAPQPAASALIVQAHEMQRSGMLTAEQVEQIEQRLSPTGGAPIRRRLSA